MSANAPAGNRTRRSLKETIFATLAYLPFSFEFEAVWGNKILIWVEVQSGAIEAAGAA
jgi:hypothetical protein